MTTYLYSIPILGIRSYVYYLPVTNFCNKYIPPILATPMGLSRGMFPEEMRNYIAEIIVRHWKEDSKQDLNELITKLKELGLTDSEISKAALNART